jgi:hypothetical protein
MSEDERSRSLFHQGGHRPPANFPKYTFVHLGRNDSPPRLQRDVNWAGQSHRNSVLRKQIRLQSESIPADLCLGVGHCWRKHPDRNRYWANHPYVKGRLSWQPSPGDITAYRGCIRKGSVTPAGSRRQVFIRDCKLNADATFLPPDDVARIDLLLG